MCPGAFLRSSRALKLQDKKDIICEKQSSKNRNFVVADCAFLRIIKSPDGSERKTCLMKKGIECPNCKDYPEGKPCAIAVRKAHTSHDRRERYWESLRKHNLVSETSKKSAFSGTSTKREEYLFCKRKRRYPDQKTAEQNRRWCEQKRGVPLRVLYCPFCNGYHLTHKYAQSQTDENRA